MGDQPLVVEFDEIFPPGKELISQKRLLVGASPGDRKKYYTVGEILGTWEINCTGLTDHVRHVARLLNAIRCMSGLICTLEDLIYETEEEKWYFIFTTKRDPDLPKGRDADEELWNVEIDWLFGAANSMHSDDSNRAGGANRAKPTPPKGSVTGAKFRTLKEHERILAQENEIENRKKREGLSLG